MHILITVKKVTLAYVEGLSAGYWVRFPEHSWWIVDALKILIVTKYTMTIYNPFTRYRFQLMKAQALVSVIYIFAYYLRLSIKKGPYRFRVGCLSLRSKKML